MAVVLLVVDASVPGCRSLKEKRKVLMSIRDRVGSHTHLGFGELAYQDKWQRTQLGFVVVGSDRGRCHQSLDHILDQLDETGDLVILDIRREDLD